MSENQFYLASVAYPGLVITLSSDESKALVLSLRNSQANAKWVIEPSGEHTWTFANASNQTVYAKPFPSAHPGAIVLATAGKYDWDIEPAGDTDEYHIVVHEMDYGLTAWSGEEGSFVGLEPLTKGANQIWKFQAVSS